MNPCRITGVQAGANGRLRIGMVTHYMPPHIGGIELVADSLFRIYLAAGCDVRWIASHAPVTSARREDGRVRVWCWNWLERAVNVPWPVWGAQGVREIARLVRWADVLHVHDCLYLGSALTVWLARRNGKPVLLSQHIGFARYRSRILCALERLAYKTLGRKVLHNASHIVFSTPAAQDFVKTLLGEHAVKTSAIAYGVDTCQFHPPTPDERAAARRSLGLPHSKRVALFVGRLNKKKGVDLFMEVSRRMPSRHFFLVGDGPAHPAAAPNLTWIPFVPPESMEMVYQASDAFMLPSQSEGFPLAVQEAMATGLPVILPSGEAFTTLLEREGACLSVARTVEALCDALRVLWETPEVAAAVASRSRHLMLRDYSLQAMRSHYLELISELAKEAQPSR